ncbi:Fe(II)-2OG oxygenase family protein [Leptospira meyeri]|uniref:TauD/TfdA family dioxygenase n=1 Tax=Leptospira meyeri TaxID=29508 RepID=UPI00223E0DBB|nr:TauD/TfdA family dioxygenase [Leptospira meyeri]MCW7490857.1 TauD/TfdA family dioxygenase [Leptospira meyeri]
MNEIKLDNFFNHISKNGWWFVDVGVNNLDMYLLSIAKYIGNINKSRRTNLVDILKPTSSENSRPESLSKIYGLGEFPLHTDTAHWAYPAKYIILGCKTKGSCDRTTTLLNWFDIKFTTSEKLLLKNAIFLFRNGSNSFYSTIESIFHPFIRYDRECMYPTSDDSSLLLEIIQEKIATIEKTAFSWENNRILIIDNWKILHGRSKTSNTNSNLSSRELHRVLVS